MPVEIKELHIKAVINQENGQTPAESAASAAPAPNQDRIVAECVEKVLEILKQQNER